MAALRPSAHALSALICCFGLACGDSGGRNEGADELGDTSSEGAETSAGSESAEESGSSDAETTAGSESADATTTAETSADTTTASESTDGPTDTGTDTGGSGCQGDPFACPPDTACDVISGECVGPEAPCSLTGEAVACGDMQCGPGSVCDDQGSCIAVAPCGNVECEGGQCWGTACVCERPLPCATATPEQLNGPFAVDIFDLEFADDCTAWMVTLRSGTDYLRRMTSGGTLTEWDGVANLNMGEVKVLKALAPQNPAPPVAGDLAPYPSQEPETVGGDLGEVAITYTCCPTCGCFVDPPQGVARLVEGEPVPLPIVLPAVPTQGTNGPFGGNAADAGPMGLTWGDDLQLYVGNAGANGDFDTADLVNQTQDLLYQYESRVTAAAPVSAVHLLVALDTGELLRFNTVTLEATPLVDLGVGVTTLSHDSFTGLVYASLSDLQIVEVDPFTGVVVDFVEDMPNLGRVAVSPDGKLWWVPAKYAVGELDMITWDLPDSF